METMFELAMGTSDIFQIQPFKLIKEVKQGPTRPKTVPASAANHFNILQPFETAPTLTNSPVAAVKNILQNISP